MSWLLACTGASRSPDRVERLARVHPPAAFTARHGNLYVAAGGLPATLAAAAGADGGWAVAGTGLRLTDGTARVLDAAAWGERLTTSPPRLDDLDGHWAALSWDAGGLHVRTDALGLRPLYYAEHDGGLWLSTRLDWLARLTGRHELAPAVFGAQWLTYSQLVPDAPVRGLHRLGPGGTLRWADGRVTAADRPWRPRPAPTAAFRDRLAAFLRPTAAAALPLSLGLSGGLDSRALLALLAGRADAAAHTFGLPGHPDVEAAHRLADLVGLPLRALPPPHLDADALLRLLREHAAQTQLSVPASAMPPLHRYDVLHRAGVVAVDGAFGEIARRRYLNRLRWRHPRLDSLSPRTILPHLRAPRPDVFAPEVADAMETGTLQQIERLWSRLPDLPPADRLDLFAVWTKLPNAYALEQARLDGQVRLFMPFAQPSVLDAVFALPLRERRDGRLLRRMIRAEAPTLARERLVKGRTTVPFGLGTLPASVWMRVQGRLRPAAVPSLRDAVLEPLRAFVLDTMHDRDVRSCGLYDVARVTAAAEAYYAGAEEHGALVDAWLAVELWRRSLRPDAASTR